MNWVSKVDYVDGVPLDRRQTKKKVWDQLTQTWKDVTIWTVIDNRELLKWLEENYPNKEGWGTAWNGARIIMEEPVYLHYCLKFGA